MRKREGTHTYRDNPLKEILGVQKNQLYYWRRILKEPEVSSQVINSQWLPLEVTDLRTITSDSIIIRIGQVSIADCPLNFGQKLTGFF